MKNVAQSRKVANLSFQLSNDATFVMSTIYICVLDEAHVSE